MSRLARLSLANRGLVALIAIIAIVARISGDSPWGDASYFMNAILRTAAGGRPYAEVEFAYGPFLLYGPLLTWRLVRHIGIGPYATYYAWVAACHVVGLFLSVYRDRLLALPDKIKRREGLFKILSWR